MGGQALGEQRRCPTQPGQEHFQERGQLRGPVASGQGKGMGAFLGTESSLCKGCWRWSSPLPPLLVEEDSRPTIPPSLLRKPPRPLVPIQGPAEVCPPITAGCIPFQVPGISGLCKHHKRFLGTYYVPCWYRQGNKTGSPLSHCSRSIIL